MTLGEISTSFDFQPHPWTRPVVPGNAARGKRVWAPSSGDLIAKLGEESGACPHWCQPGAPRIGMGSKVGVWAEDDHPWDRGRGGACPPCGQARPPIGTAIAPVHQEQIDRSCRRQVDGILDAAQLADGASESFGDARGRDQVSAEENDPHSADAGLGGPIGGRNGVPGVA